MTDTLQSILAEMHSDDSELVGHYADRLQALAASGREAVYTQEMVDRAEAMGHSENADYMRQRISYPAVAGYRHYWPNGKVVISDNIKPPGGFDGWAAVTQRLIVHPDDIRTVTQEGLDRG